MPSSTSGEETPALPNGFVSIERILAEVIPKGKFTNVIGLVKDCRLPIPTRGTDYKCTMVLYDLSTESSGIELVIFRPENEMPVVRAADVVLLKQVRIQQFGGGISLITNHATSISVYKAARIPKPPASAHIALIPSNRKKAYKEPTDVENSYVSQIFHRIDKYDIPDEQEFQEKSTISLNVKQKFSLLKDVEDSNFYDLIVRVAREPYDFGDKVTLYVTDYTENDGFFNYTKEGVQDLDTRGDVWGYTNNNDGKENDEPDETGWVGPYGKKAMQVTVFDSHAEFARENLRAGMWINMKNVWIKHGSDGRYLEGYVREAINQTVSTNHLIVLGRDNKDPRLEAALKRCKAHKIDNDDIKKKSDRDSERNKRKRDEDSAEAANSKKKASLNSKQRRKLKRQQVEAEAAAKAKYQGITQSNVAVVPEHATNQSIVCEHPDKPITPLSAMLEHQPFEIIVNGQTLSYPLPFVNNNYRAHVRVVDFKPFNLEEFAISRNPINWEDGGNTDDPDDSGTDTSNVRGGGSRKVWEWAFELCLEDAINSGSKTRQWVTVDNFAAQCLTGLDASDLRQDKSKLTSLREKMFYLWGELEEKKHNTLALRKTMMQQRRAAPPPTASQEDDVEEEVNVNNVPFTCCIRQWGVEVKENGEKKWQRMFGMFGTKIAA